MLATPKCFIRKCKWFCGVIQPDGTEMTERNFCGAFPKGIPGNIAYGDDDHTKALEGQAKPYVYEKDTDWENHYDNLPQDDVDTWEKINSGGEEKQEPLGISKFFLGER